MSGVSIGTCVPNFKSVDTTSLTVFELLAFNAQKSTAPGRTVHTLFRTIVMGSGLSLGTCLSNVI